MKLLPRTPGPRSEESPAGYLLRLAQVNGYAGTSTLIEMIEGHPEHIPTPGWDYRKLQLVLGMQQILPRGFGYRSAEKYVRGTVSLLGQNLTSRHLGLRKARVCTQCIEELGYIPAAWDLKAYVACPIHGQMMLKHCASCGNRIRMNRAALLRCRCGADLRQMQPEPATKSLIALMEVLHANVTKQSGCLVVAHGNGMPVTALLACDLDILCKIIVTIATLFSWMHNSVRTPRKTTEIVKYLPQVGEALSRWPHNFHKLCGDWHRHSIQKGGCSQKFQACFKWLFEFLYKNLRKKKYQTQFMLEAALAYGYRNWDLSPVRIQVRALRILNLPPRRYGSYGDAARITGIPLYSVVRWVARGRLPARSAGTLRRPTRVMDLDFLAALKFSSSPGLSKRNAARRAGIPNKALVVLRKDGDIACTYMTEFRSAIAIEDLDEFVSSVVRNASATYSKRARYPLADFLNASIPVTRKVQLLRDIRDGHVCVHKKGKPCIQNLYLQEDLLGMLRSEMRTTRKTITVCPAMVRHDLSYDEARAIFSKLNAGRNSTAETAREYIDTDRLDEFMREFVPLRLVAKDEHITGALMRRAVEEHSPECLLVLSSGHKPASRPSVACAMFLKRRRLAKVRRLAQALSPVA